MVKIKRFNKKGVYLLRAPEVEGAVEARWRIGSGTFSERISPRNKEKYHPWRAFALDVPRALLYKVEYSFHFLMEMSGFRRNGAKEEFFSGNSCHGDYYGVLKPFDHLGDMQYRCISKDEGETSYYSGISEAWENREGGQIYGKVVSTEVLADIMLFSLWSNRRNLTNEGRPKPEFNSKGLGHFISTMIGLGKKKDCYYLQALINIYVDKQIKEGVI